MERNCCMILLVKDKKETSTRLKHGKDPEKGIYLLNRSYMTFLNVLF